ncbi:hypothetical protein B0T10DRAFT_452776 [Thelonectria olida]|uniref:Uncharacterized protein n=1 Tax=Thelonectria olida TaxID=1576542 RepID=A0A9P8WKS8_9HYPO|nr:hypothetical protein B0T10DRAFT_452776 [Thelonectria olida]
MPNETEESRRYDGGRWYLVAFEGHVIQLVGQASGHNGGMSTDRKDSHCNSGSQMGAEHSSTRKGMWRITKRLVSMLLRTQDASGFEKESQDEQTRGVFGMGTYLRQANKMEAKTEAISVGKHDNLDIPYGGAWLDLFQPTLSTEHISACVPRVRTPTWEAPALQTQNGASVDVGRIVCLEISHGWKQIADSASWKLGTHLAHAMIVGERLLFERSRRRPVVVWHGLSDVAQENWTLSQKTLLTTQSHAQRLTCNAMSPCRPYNKEDDYKRLGMWAVEKRRPSNVPPSDSPASPASCRQPCGIAGWAVGNMVSLGQVEPCFQLQVYQERILSQQEAPKRTEQFSQAPVHDEWPRK